MSVFSKVSGLFSAGSKVASLLAAAGDFIAFGVHPAATGAVRLSNNTGVSYRNAGNTLDVNLLSSDGSNNLFIGDGNVPTAFVGCPAQINGALSLNSTVGGTSGHPVNFTSSSAISVASAAVTLSAAQIATPVIPLTGTVNASNCTITLPNNVGAFWLFDFTAVTFSAHSVIFTTGSGTTVTITAIGIAGQFLLVVCVPSSNVVSAGGL